MDYAIRFIKLGVGGEWESSCIKESTIRLGYISPFHEESLQGDWTSVRNFWLTERKGKERVASNDMTQIRAFYEASEKDIWVTFYQRKMYWCRASAKVELLDDGSRIRRVLGHWSCLDQNGEKITIENLDGRISKVQAYRGTICSVELPEYLDRKIKAIPNPDVKLAKDNLDLLLISIEDLIKGLWWYDFELLVDLVFTKSGWHRYSVLGKTEKDLDLDLYSPTTEKRAFAQVKSSTSQREVSEYIEKFDKYDNYDEFFFIFHTCNEELDEVSYKDKKYHVIGGRSLARLIVTTGLVQWLIDKRT
ncbi:hypothetical protein GLP30_11915 [Photobacterium phosphoreum]|uniref:Restriction endonuclease type IV Mrr domain-containing protein n=1 Tax=Photobacterium phosphoreum TaxID=659 RepID=A0AAW4ZYQ4_PHOPO|nr:hypothetical protein [Photobacterium phosphoreum]MCD9491525.1 hypothetical protein [Photobacterium phosphoreum]MCF2190791.1 hypothetical protein [Photobacterium phosphoreum]MCF2302434.1 hypothetical protein [Photobacterium phosphoreum]PSU64635.1 hypothetical protein CTM75_05590 [Photobacterium phosphoreum]